MRSYYVYILSSQRNGTLYVGSTSDLVKRVWAHKNKVIPGFTEKYNVNQLVYYEMHELLIPVKPPDGKNVLKIGADSGS